MLVRTSAACGRQTVFAEVKLASRKNQVGIGEYAPIKMRLAAIRFKS